MDNAQTGWYLVYTKPRHENIAEINLKRQGFNIYLPLYKQHKRKKDIYQLIAEPLFPRYLFIRLNSKVDDWSKIRSTRGCISLVRFSTLPARVPDGLIEKLQQGDNARMTETCMSTPEFKPGDRVQILDGILSGYEGIVTIKNSKQRVTLLLSMLEGHSRCINLSAHQIKIIA